ncbi:MAG: hypothetical protein HOL13_01835, partial [Phycisphaerae bacterium]|nr:hypothetical protein [Phycisphaerae bacterium]
MLRKFAFFAAATALLAGCSLTYQVTMTADHGTINRETTVSSEIEPLEIAELTETFGAPDRSDEPGYAKNAKTLLTFHRTESDETWPDGFGGRGSWQVIDTPIGTAHCFLECLGGDTYIADDLLALQDGIDAVSLLIRRELRTSLQGEKILPKLLNLIDQRIAPDAKDLAVMGWALLFAYEMLPPEATEGGIMTEYFEQRLQEAAAAFLWQREWLTANEASMLALGEIELDEDLATMIIARSLDVNMRGDWKPTAEYIETLLKNVFPEDFDSQLVATFTEAVGEHSRLAVAWAATTAILTNREVEVRMKSASEPAITNGTWDSSQGAIIWTLETAPLAVGVTTPPLCW